MKTLLTFVFTLSLLLTSRTAFSQYYTENKAEHDSLAVILLDAVENNRPITGELLEIAMAVAGDNIIATTLKEGHKEYVSMPNRVKGGIMSNVLSRLDRMEASGGTSGEVIDNLIQTIDRVNDLEELMITNDQVRQQQVLESMIFRFENRQKVGIYTPPYKK